MPRKATKKTKTDVDLELIKELRILTKEVNNLKQLEFLKVFKHPLKYMWFTFLKGLMVGFGSVLGATVLVALLIFILSQISFVPIVGDFVQEILNQINQEETLVSKLYH